MLLGSLRGLPAALTLRSAPSRRAGPRPAEAGQTGRAPPPPLHYPSFPPCPSPAEGSATSTFPGQPRRRGPAIGRSPARGEPGPAWPRNCLLTAPLLPPRPPLSRAPRSAALAGSAGCPTAARTGCPSPSSFPRKRHGLRGSERRPLRQRSLRTGRSQAALVAPRVIDGARSDSPRPSSMRGATGTQSSSRPEGGISAHRGAAARSLSRPGKQNAAAAVC